MPPRPITPALLEAMFEGFNTKFSLAFAGVTPEWKRVAMEVPSSASAENYGWMSQVPRIREWIGDRVVNAIKAYGYRIANRTFETTIGVPRESIEDDTYGVFAPLFSEMGRSVGLFPDELVFPLLDAGFSSPCYDGQNFFDPEHPVLDANGNPQPVSNVQTGAGPAWFLMDTSRFVQPLVYQPRRPFELIAKTDARASDHVFMQKEYLYGADGRCNAGYGFWQFAFGSQAPLNRANFRAARAAMINLKGDYGRPLGVKPNVLAVGPSLEQTARDLIKSKFLAVDGAPGEPALVGAVGVMDNTDQDIVEVFMSPWLS
ncbi:MAG: Mu-like prophage major head subunit gpT family protein [Roseiarcus sp.]